MSGWVEQGPDLARDGVVRWLCGQIVLAADVTTEANDVHQLTPMLGQAQANVALVTGQDAGLGAAVADACCWSDASAAAETDRCELFIATQRDHAQRAALRDAPPRGRKPKNMKLRERMQRKLRTKRARARPLSPARGLGRASVRPDEGPPGRSPVQHARARPLRGEWLLDAAVHNLRKLHRDSARRMEKARERAAERMQRAA